MNELCTNAEHRAEKAENLRAFSGLKLNHIKHQATKLLGLIGKDGIFDEYTLHDVSHINKLLNSLDWIIPQETQEKMSPTDWLLVVLSIYFHDLGMLVTKKEYQQRKMSSFEQFCEEILFTGKHGTDYKNRVKELGDAAGQRFLYQEFVRYNHATRIKHWIEGKASSELGYSKEIVEEFESLLEALSPKFRRDLGVVCKSHHEDDLHDLNKYKVSQPYGDTDEETGNLQYAALLLRTVDLLHITQDRTPSIMFRVVTPTDPISIIEWKKQMAVTTVRSQVGLNDEGVSDEKAPRDTIEIHAYFQETQKDGFFALTSYISYTKDQIKKNLEWAKKANEEKGVHHKYPWRHIDDSNIETEGFLPNKFKFELDQEKILDLLTGHTLYGDTTVVLRELAQNAVDAVRLQAYMYEKQSKEDVHYQGKVNIRWDSRKKTLEIQDNGTGMTQQIIEDHFLKVGSSRYQGEKFQKEHPGFSSISRFGIGVLSVFMIADSVEIKTSHMREEKARQVLLRSVHGHYLIQTIDKQKIPGLDSKLLHGTSVTLKIRPSIGDVDFSTIVNKWIIVPECLKSEVSRNEAAPIERKGMHFV